MAEQHPSTPSQLLTASEIADRVAREAAHTSAPAARANSQTSALPRVRSSSAPSRYVIAAVAVLVAFALRMTLSRYIGPPYILFYPTVMLAAVLGGVGPGLLATAMSTVLAAFWILPAERQFLPMTTRDAVGLAVFASIGVFMSVVADRYRKARHRLGELAKDRALRETEERFRAFFHNPAVGTALIDLEGRFREVNDRCCEITGYSREELLRMTVTDLWPEEDRRRERAHLSSIVRGGGGQYDRETRYLRKDRSVIWAHVTSGLIRDEAGRPVRWGGVIEDVTERKRIEDALKRSESILAQAGTMARLGAWWIEVSNPEDVNANPLRWSDEAFRIFGYEPGRVEVTNQLFFERVHLEDRQRVGEAFARALAERRPYEIEHRIVRPDGSERVVLEHADFVFDDRRRLLRAIGAVQDVTDRRREEEALRESETRFRQLADSMPQIVWASRPDGFVDYYNRKWYELTGAVEGALGDESWLPILHPEDRQRCLDVWYESVRTGKPYQIEHRLKVPSTGDYRWHLERALPVRDEAGNIVRWFGTFTDIHDQKLAAEAVENANRRKNEFLGVLSHELRNPLAPIRNALYIIDSTPAASEQAKRAKQVIARQVSHLTRLVDDLLDVTRISRGKIQLRRGRVDLVDLVRRAVEDHRTIFAAREISVSLRLGSGPLWIDADATRIEQAIGNLLQNAAKFTNAHGHVVVTVESEGTCGLVRVADDGIGIMAELQPHVFEPFRQADESLHRSLGGLGLGLALVRGFVEMHGGRVDLRSEGAGRGTEFTVSLPLLADAAPRAEAAPARPGAPARRRVLIIEDNLDAAETLKEVLEMNGQEVVAVAYDGSDGVAKARALRPDIVLCDIGLPGFDGYEVARQLRADPHLPATLVALTGYARPEDQRRTIESGFDHHLGKPLEMAQLDDVLARVNGNERARS